MHINMLGGLQPDKLDGMLLKGDDDGLFARVACFWPDRVPLKIPNGDVADDGQLYRVASRLLTLDFDPAGKPVVIPLADAARAMFETWYLSQEQKVAGATGLYAGALGKRQGLVLRLSLVLEHIRWACGTDPCPPRTVGVDSLKAAIALADDYLDAHAAPRARRCRHYTRGTGGAGARHGHHRRWALGDKRAGSEISEAGQEPAGRGS